MPIGLIDNPGAANSDSYSGLAAAQLGPTTIDAVNGDTVALTSGMLVAVVSTGYVPGVGVQFKVRRNPTTATPLCIGVVVDAAGAGIPVGGIVQVRISGPVNMLMDNNSTTIGHYVLQSTTTLANGTDSASATAGVTVGVVLQTLTVSAVNTMVSVYISRM
jgi:hypothetical protein